MSALSRFVEMLLCRGRDREREREEKEREHRERLDYICRLRNRSLDAALNAEAAIQRLGQIVAGRRPNGVDN